MVLFDAILNRFCEQTPFAVMLRASLEHLFAPQRLDELFEREAVDQYTRRLTFSAVADLLCEVVLRVRPSVRKAYQSADLPASLRAVYDKLAHVETGTAEALVRQVAADAASVIDLLPGGLRPDPVAGLRLKTVDGNYLAGTDRRLKELRGSGAAALPGMSVVLRDDRTGLLSEALLREDAYTNERALSELILAWLAADDLLLGDRNYCTLDLFRGVILRQAFFLIRHNKALHLHALSERKRVGKTETGVVYQYRVRLGEGRDAPECRCIVIELFEPTRDGDTEVVLLTNVPAKRAKAKDLADLYQRRWRLETSFQELTVLMRCEVDTLAYPKAALFGFALALAAYNVYALLQAAVASAHGREKAEEELSLHAVVEEVSSVKRGMETALPDEVWERFARMSGAEFALWLRRTALLMDWDRYQKSKRGPKKPAKVKRTQRGAHRSTARLLAQRKN
jgi:Transposase DDE domain